MLDIKKKKKKTNCLLGTFYLYLTLRQDILYNIQLNSIYLCTIYIQVFYNMFNIDKTFEHRKINNICAFHLK